MMKYILGFLMFLILLQSCGDENLNEQQTQEVRKDTSFYGTTSFSLPKLNAQANFVVENWPIFKDFNNEASKLHNIQLEALKQQTERLLTHTDSLSKSIPDTLSTKAIQSRITIVNTRVNLLKQEVNRDKTRPEEIENQLKEVQKAVSTFIIQINEKVLKDKIDFQRKDDEQKELEKQKRARDSIFQLELQDQK